MMGELKAPPHGNTYQRSHAGLPIMVVGEGVRLAHVGGM